MNLPTFETRHLGRRAFLGAGLSAVSLVALSGCASEPALATSGSRAVLDAEKARKGTGIVKNVTLRAAPTQIDLAGRTVNTWSFGSVPSPVVRLSAGDTLRAQVQNDLPTATSVHWHGLALRNDMDGVPPVTQSAIAAGKDFTYDFIAPHPGTYWFHPHVGVQLDRGLYGALIIDDPKEPLSYDEEWVVILDDWLDGVTSTPDKILKELSGGMKGGGMDGMRMGNMLMGARSALLGGDAGDVFYPTYLVNGRPPEDPETYTSKPGTRVRIRLINAGSDTAFRVALGGHTLTITHSDGFPVVPADFDSVLIGMGERYDVVTTLRDGVFPFVASAEGKKSAGFALVRTGAGQAPAPDVTVEELTKRVGTASKLSSSPEVQLAARNTDRKISLTLTGSMMKYDWAINGRRFDGKNPLASLDTVRAGERVQLSFINKTTMWHPMHLHGHTYQHPDGGPRKDTSIVLPGQTLRVAFDADNPGRWVAHCHNIYHAESGMMSVVAYQA
ncbi:MAG: multicopper oxidase family protein [Actinomycetota bacterium]